jgi:hypothetical protein
VGFLGGFFGFYWAGFLLPTLAKDLVVISCMSDCYAVTLLSTARLVKEALSSSPAYLPGIDNILFLLIQGTNTIQLFTASVHPNYCNMQLRIIQYR